jgi:hypothetical protein
VSFGQFGPIVEPAVAPTPMMRHGYKLHDRLDFAGSATQSGVTCLITSGMDRIVGPSAAMPNLTIAAGDAYWPVRPCAIQMATISPRSVAITHTRVSDLNRPLKQATQLVLQEVQRRIC